MLAFLIVFLTLVVIVYVIINTLMKPKKFPPGPKWYPFLGSSNAVHNAALKYGSQFKGLQELSKQYSTEVLGLKLGGELVVVVYGEKNIKQVFTEKTFEGRPNSFFLRLRCLGKKMGITFTDGPLWKIHRQFTLTQLRNVGFGKTPMEKEIQNELQGIVRYLKQNCHKPIIPNSFVSQAVMNVLWKFVAGEKIEEDRWRHMQELFRMRSNAFSMAGGLLNQFPWCRFLIPNLSGYTLITKLNRQISDIIEEAITKHKKHEIDGKDFIYSFLEEMASDKESFTEEQLKMVCLDLLIAGAQTTGNLLEFALIQVLRNKAIQEKIYDEIEQVLGGNIPSWTDLAKLTYTSAFVLELQRYHPIAPLAGPRRVLDNTVIDGFLIPKDTTVLISVGDIHFDPELWGDPHVFKPERFIDERGMIKNTEHMYPFGLGTLQYMALRKNSYIPKIFTRYSVRACYTYWEFSRCNSNINLPADKCLYEVFPKFDYNPTQMCLYLALFLLTERVHVCRRLIPLRACGFAVLNSGRRRCPGDSLAKSFIFITFVGILQHFRIESVNGEVPSSEPVIGLIASPKAFRADFVPRK